MQQGDRVRICFELAPSINAPASTPRSHFFRVRGSLHHASAHNQFWRCQALDLVRRAIPGKFVGAPGLGVENQGDGELA